MGRKKGENVRIVLGNPYYFAWKQLSKSQCEEAMKLLRTDCLALQRLSLEDIGDREVPEVLVDLPIIFDRIEEVAAVVVLRTEVNQVVIEPLMHCCEDRGIPVLAAWCQDIAEDMKRLTGGEELQAFALLRSTPLTAAFLRSLDPPQPHRLHPPALAAIAKKQTTRQINPAR